MIRFTPKSEDQINAARLLKPGFGNYEITRAELKNDRNGNPLLYIVLKTIDENKKEGLIHDYIPIYDENFSWKLRHFMYSCNLGKEYEDGFIDEKNLLKRRGKLKIGIKKDKNGQYPDSNNVLDYMVPTTQANLVSSIKTESSEINPPPLDDSLPFN